MKVIYVFLSLLLLSHAHLYAELLNELLWVSPCNGKNLVCIGENNSMVLATGGAAHASVWDATTGQLIRTPVDAFGNTYMALAWETGSDFGVVCAKSGKAVFMNFRTGAIISELFQAATYNLGQFYVRNVALNSKANTVYALFSDRIEIWDASAGTLKKTLAGGGSNIVTNNQKTRALIVNTMSPTVITLLDLESLNIIDEFMFPAYDVNNSNDQPPVLFSPNGELFAILPPQGFVELRDADKGTLLYVFDHLYKISQEISSHLPVCFSPSSDKIAILGVKDESVSVKVWEAKSGKIITEIPELTSLLGFRKNGRNIVSIESRVINGVMTKGICETDSNNYTQLLYELKSVVKSVSWSNLCEDCLRIEEDQQNRIVDISTGKEKINIPTSIFKPEDKIVHFSDNYTVIQRNNAPYMLVDSKTGVAFSTNFKYGGYFNSIGNTLLTVEPCKNAKLWDVKTGTLLFTIDGYEKGVCSAVRSKDDELIITQDGDGAVRVWSAVNGELLSTLKAHENDNKPIGNALPNSDRNMVMTIQGNSFHIWNAQNGSYIRTIIPEGTISSYFTASNNTFLTNSRLSENTSLITLWNLATGEIELRKVFNMQLTDITLNKFENRILLKSDEDPYGEAKNAFILMTYPTFFKVNEFRSQYSLNLEYSLSKGGNFVLDNTGNVYSANTGRLLCVIRNYDRRCRTLSLDDDRLLSIDNNAGLLTMWRVKELNMNDIKQSHEDSNTRRYKSDNLALFPNPVYDILHVPMTNVQGTEYPFTILNSRSEKIMSGYVPQGTEEYKISTSELESGTYMLILGTDNVIYEKFIVVR